MDGMTYLFPNVPEADCNGGILIVSGLGIYRTLDFKWADTENPVTMPTSDSCDVGDCQYCFLIYTFNAREPFARWQYTKLVLGNFKSMFSTPTWMIPGQKLR